MSMMSTLFDAVNILPLSLLSMLIFGSYAGIPQRSLPAFMICTAFTLWLIALRNMKLKNRLRSTGIVAVFTVGLLLAAGEEHRQVFFEKHFWVIWLICFCIGATAAGLIMYKNIWLRRAAALGFLAYALAGITVKELGVSKEIFALICFVVLIRLTEEIQRRWVKSGSPETDGHITRTAPFLAALCLIVYLIPAPAEPFGWEFAKDIFNKTISYFSRLFGFGSDSSEDYGMIGFSDEGGFLSGLSSNNDEVLFITVNNTSIKEFRLVGCMSGEFRGLNWVFDNSTESSYRVTDTVETSAAVRKFASSSLYDYLKGTEMSFETRFYNTRYIFAPAKIRLDASREKSLAMSERSGSLISDKSLGYKDNYRISCFLLNYDNPSLKELLDNAEPLTESEWTAAAAAEGVSGKAGLSFADYQEYRKTVYEKYCRPCGVSDKVAEILDRIQSGSSGRYETAKRLEAFLNQMDYSRDCGAFPDSVTDAESFLDYFLFTSQKGYCMHYSTAFVLMANEMGIPCRQVQGYSVKKGSGSTVTVRENEAHAWPEVYFDNVGWVAFEPTPGYSVPAGWEVDDRNASLPENWNAQLDIDITPPDSAAIAGETEDEKSGISPLIFIIPSLGVISFLLLFYAVSRALAAKRYRRMSSYDKFRYLAQQCIRYIGYLGLPLEEGETLSEYSGRITASDDQQLKEHTGFIPVYERVLYSDFSLTEEELRSAEQTARALRRLAKKRRLRNRLMILIGDR
ncbi:MAG: transglutaminase domain-containing protein [Ruminococcus sp.]|nr:transglutaminase domain-containing protein [Ruminococcus sp.]